MPGFCGKKVFNPGKRTTPPKHGWVLVTISHRCNTQTQTHEQKD